MKLQEETTIQEARMKTRTLPAVSDELIIPKPAPGENVFPIFSQGVICGYVYSGGNQKKPKIFLTEESEAAPAEEKPMKTKNDDSKKESSVVKISEKTEAKCTAKRPVKRKSKKGKMVSAPGKKPGLPNNIDSKVLKANLSDDLLAPGKKPGLPNNIDSKVLKANLSDDLSAPGKKPGLPKTPSIDSRVLKANLSDDLDIACSPTKHAKGDHVDLGRQRSALNDGVSIPVLKSPSKMALSPAKKNVQMANPMDVSNLNANPKPPLFPSSASYVSTDAKNPRILPRPMQPNYSQPLILASNNSALKATNWMNAPLQPNWPNNVTYFLVPAGDQGQVLLASSANSLPNVLPTVTTPLLSRTTASITPTPPTTSTASLSRTTEFTTPSLSNTTASITASLSRIAAFSAPSLSRTPASTTASLSRTPASSAPSLSRTLAFTAASTTPFLSQTPASTAASLSRTSASTAASLSRIAASTIPFLTRTTASTVDSSVFQPSSTTTSTTIAPILMRALPSPVTSSNDSNSQPLATLPLKGVMPKSTYVQLPSGPSSGNQKLDFLLGYRQPIPPKFKLLKLKNLETEKGACKFKLSSIFPVANDEKAGKESASIGSGDQSDDSDRPATELLKHLQEKTINSNLSTSSEQTKNSEASCAASSFTSVEDQGHYYQVSTALIRKRPRGRPRKLDIKKVSLKKDPIPILPATENNLETSQGSMNLAAAPLDRRLRGRPKKARPAPKILVERMCKDVASCSERKKADGSADESTKNMQEMIESETNANSNQVHKSESSASSAPLIPQKKSLESLIDNTESSLAIHKSESSASSAPLIPQKKSLESLIDNTESSLAIHKSESSASSAPLIPQKKSLKSLIDNTKSSLAIHTKKRQRAQKKKDQPLQTCDKPISSSATGSHSETESPNNPFSFNLLPSGTYVLGSQKEVNISDGTLSKELNEHAPEHEKHKQMTFKEENNGDDTVVAVCKPSLCDKNKMTLLSRENEISIKQEPLDYDSGVDQGESGNLSDNCMSSTPANAADVQPPLLCKEENVSEDESITNREEGENQLVISSCFSLTSRTESDGKLTAIDSENSDLDNLFFRRRKTDSNDSTGLDDTNVEEEMKDEECKVEPSLLSNSLISSSVSSSSGDDLVSSSKGDNLPCTKLTAENSNASPEDEKSKIEIFDSPLKVSVLTSLISSSVSSSSGDDLVSSSKGDNLPCTKLTAENSNASSEDEKSKIEIFDSPLKVPVLTSKTKRSLEALAKSVLDQGHLKTLKENHEIVDLTSEPSVIVSSLLETGIKRALESPADSFYQPGSPKKMKENDDTTLDSSSVAVLPVTKKSAEVSAKTIADAEHWKNMKEKNISDDKIEIPFLPIDEKVSSKSKSLTISKDDPSIPSLVNNYLKTTGKRLGTLESNGESMVIDLTNDRESDTFIEGCIAFHEQQMYMLELQMEQHKKALEKLRKELIYRKSSK